MPGGSGGDKQTVVQKSQPWEPQQEYLKNIYSQAQMLYNNYAPQYYPQSTVAGMSPYTQGGIAELANFGNSPYYQSALGAAQGSMGTLGDAQSPYTNPLLGMGYSQMPGLQSYLSKTLSGQNGAKYNNAQAGQIMPNYNQMVGPMTQNPYLDSAVNNAMKRVTQNFNESVLPQISLNSLGSNNFGGSRQGVAEGLAASRLQQEMGDLASQMYGSAYESGQNRALQGGTNQAQLTQQTNLQNALQQLQAAQLNQQGQQFAAGMGGNMLQSGYGNALDAARLQLAMSPQYAQLGQMGTQSLLQAGQLDQAYNQQLLDDAVARWNFTQNLPQMLLNNYTANTQGNVGSSSTQQTSGATGSSSPLMGALGGGMGAAGLASMLGMFGSAAVPATATAAAIPAVAASSFLWPLIAGGAILGAVGNS